MTEWRPSEYHAYVAASEALADAVELRNRATCDGDLRLALAKVQETATALADAANAYAVKLARLIGPNYCGYCGNESDVWYEGPASTPIGTITDRWCGPCQAGLAATFPEEAAKARRV